MVTPLELFRLPLQGTCRLLPAHQIEVFNILPVKFDGKAFEFDDFHECLTLPLPFDRNNHSVMFAISPPVPGSAYRTLKPVVSRR